LSFKISKGSEDSKNINSFIFAISLVSYSKIFPTNNLHTKDSLIFELKFIDSIDSHREFDRSHLKNERIGNLINENLCLRKKRYIKECYENSVEKW